MRPMDIVKDRPKDWEYVSGKSPEKVAFELGLRDCNHYEEVNHIGLYTNLEIYAYTMGFTFGKDINRGKIL